MTSTTDLLSIGRFSRLSGISVPSLRRYDAMALLPPASVDPQSGYRRYDPAQLARARAIRRLRDLDVPLDAVRAFLDADASSASRLLEQHRARLESRAWRDQRILHHLRQLTDGRELLMADDHARLQPDAGEQRRLAADLFNLVWTMLETPDRTEEQDERMLHAAHASRFHWGEVGEPVNLARGDWQVSRVYAVLGRAEPALHHAQRCLETCRANDIEDFDLAFAYEALARAHLVAGDSHAADRYRSLASQAGTDIADDEDRTHFEEQLGSISAVR
jgi:DNA-binding transcriptional MerR regulator